MKSMAELTHLREIYADMSSLARTLTNELAKTSKPIIRI